MPPLPSLPTSGAQVLVSGKDVGEKDGEKCYITSSKMKQGDCFFLIQQRTPRVCFQFVPQKRRARTRTYSSGERLHTDVTKSEIAEKLNHVAQMNLMNFSRRLIVALQNRNFGEPDA